MIPVVPSVMSLVRSASSLFSSRPVKLAPVFDRNKGLFFSSLTGKVIRYFFNAFTYCTDKSVVAKNLNDNTVANARLFWPFQFQVGNACKTKEYLLKKLKDVKLKIKPF